VNDSTALLLLFLVLVIVVISHEFCCFYDNFLILWCSASLVLLFCLVSFPSFLAFPLFFTLWAIYQYLWIVCYTFNNYLTTLIDVYCMLQYFNQSVVCVLPSS
jgi:hypothetical protein